jgi:RND family efflux transporter MFP subunit
MRGYVAKHNRLRGAFRRCLGAIPSGPLPACLRLIALLLALALIGGCEEKNTFVAPPPPKVTVAKPVRKTVTDYLDLTGNTQAINTVKLVARVEGYLEGLHFQDGADVRKGDLLFTIQPDQYEAQLAQAKANVAAQQAALFNAETEFARYSRLFEQKAAAATDVDNWRFQRDSARAALASAQAQVELAQLNLSYTKVTAPFNGRMGRHLVDVGNVVGAGGEETPLAEINQIDPIYVYFTINELDLLRIRERQMEAGGGDYRTRPVPVFAGLANEEGYPHEGRIDFAAISVDPSTGTLLLRGIFANPDRVLLPGLFVRLRLPVGRDKDAILVPEVALGLDQIGRYVLVVDDKNVVERRAVKVGQAFEEMRVIADGLTGDERVVVNGLLRAIPGREVTPETQTATAQPAAAGRS